MFKVQRPRSLVVRGAGSCVAGAGVSRSGVLVSGVIACLATAVIGAQTPITVLEMKGTAAGTIALKVNAPGATTISAFVDTMLAGNARPLTRDERGVWSGEIGPLAPDIYEAALIVGTSLRPIGTVTVPGTPPEVWEARKGPHGELHQLWYDSSAVKALRSVWVYTPPGYEKNTTQQYPILYLLHGSGGAEGSWVDGGAANVILDNLIASGKAQPMIVAMPFGHSEPSPRAGSTPTYTGRDATAVTRDLLDEMMPLVESRFRVRRRSDSRAIAGLSMGGGQARTIGLSMPDLFRWVGTFSGSMPRLRGTPSLDAIESMLGAEFLADSFGTNANIKLLWMSVGDDEAGMLTQHKAMTDLLRNHGIRHTFVTYPGGHTWHVWRRSLRDFVPLLFQK